MEIPSRCYASNAFVCYLLRMRVAALNMSKSEENIMTARIQSYRLQVAAHLHSFIVDEVLPGTGIDSAAFWHRFDALVHDLAPKNRALLAERERLQAEMDQWHRQHSGPISDMPAYKSFLKTIGYLRPVPLKVKVSTSHVDTEISLQGGPQLVAPLTNARYTLNAANARWLSLYDASYGTDVISEDGGATRAGAYNPVRGSKVIAFGRDFLDQAIPLQTGSHHQACDYAFHQGKLQITLDNGDIVGLKQPELFIAYNGNPPAIDTLLFRHNELHIEIQIDKAHPLTAQDPAGIKDIVLESATTAVMDLEDAVSAVDEYDKVIAYRNWLHLMKGDLKVEMPGNGRTVTRRMNLDRKYIAVDGQELKLHGRSLMFVRNVGHLMGSPAILDSEGNNIPEGILDAVVTILIALHDQQRRANSRAGSI